MPAPQAEPLSTHKKKRAPAKISPKDVPSAPRKISYLYTWKLLASDVGGVVAMIFLFLGYFFYNLGGGPTLGSGTDFLDLPILLISLALLGGGGLLGIKRYQHFAQRVRVLRKGLAILGEIYEVTVDRSLAINGKNPWKVTYIYAVGGTDYDGEITTLVPPKYLAAGQAAVVLYLAAKPDISSLFPHP